MTDKSPVPEKGTAQWRKNEKMINENPVLKKARDIQQGLTTRGDITLGAPSEAYKANYDKIDWSKK